MMSLSRRLIRNRDGAAAVEFGLTAPLFFLLIFGAIQVGFWLVQAFGLQHAVEMAARCAAISYNNNFSACPTGAPQTYAATQVYGMTVSPSVFSVSQPSCGYQVSAVMALPTFAAGLGLPSVTFHARSCFPT